MSDGDEIIAERYRLERVLGQGGMGVVWAARDLRSEERVALKFLKAGEGGEAGIRRFVREARAAMALSHPNIVHVHTLTADRHGSPVMVMDLLEGESLATRLRRVRRLEVSTLAGILVQIVSAVGAAHAAGIVHRDLKPDNVFLVGEPPSVRVLDFGIAKLTAREGDAAASTALTNTGAMLGTPFYMAPEQVFGERDLDHRADVGTA
ncbi:MAG: serine/threonine protein kinase [Myxococcales bacterium]|nr:serine/threonine protein kinase [Myxococcales bacterium]